MELLKSHCSFGGVTEFWQHSSQLTETPMKFAISRPEKLDTIAGGLIWLSGLTCNEQNFITKAGAQQYANKYNLVLICPDTSPRGTDLPGEHESYDFGSGAGFYIDATTEHYRKHYKMYSYINNELYSLFNEKYSLKGKIGIFGHSMGGHGALISGLKNPKNYKSVSAFSPIVNPTQSSWGKKAFTGYLGGDEGSWLAYDACELLKSDYKTSSAILIDQGLSDDFYPQQLLTENIEKVAKQKSQPVKVNYHEGYDHSYFFISTFIESHIKHHFNQLTQATN